MKRMTDKSITDSAHKKACTVHTALANNIETYVSILRDMILGAPASQDFSLLGKNSLHLKCNA
jgi:hypothetical protein